MLSVNPETGKVRISASKMRTFMTCPLQAKFQYLDRLPRKQNASGVFGICIHKALEHYNLSGNLDETITLFETIWDDPESIDEHIDVWPKGITYGTLRERGLETLRNYHGTVKWEKRDVLATEHRFAVPFGDFELVGFVDLVEIKKDSRGRPGLRIVDYKTNKRQPYRNSLSLDVQFTTYVYAAMQPEFWTGYGGVDGMENGEWHWINTQGLKPRGIWYHLETNKEIDAGPRDDADFMRLYRACVEIKKAVEHDVFIPDISGDSCVFCSYTKPCGLPIHVPGEEDD